MEVSVNIFVVAEVILLYNLFFRVINLQKLRVILKTSLVIFIFYTTTMLVFTDALLMNATKIIVGEAFLILISICLYFIQLFKLPPTLSQFTQPAFWIVIGVLFVFSCTLPLTILEFLAQNYIKGNLYFYYINFICYSVLFLFIIRAIYAIANL